MFEALVSLSPVCSTNEYSDSPLKSNALQKSCVGYILNVLCQKKCDKYRQRNKNY